MSSTTQTSSDIRHAAELLHALTLRIILTATAERIRLIEENDLSMTQAKALLLLVEGGESSGGQIAERLGVSPAAASRALDGMIQKGLATRSECADDRRVRLIAATPAAAEIAADIANLRKAQIERFLAGVDPTALEGLIAALEPLGLGETADEPEASS